MRVRGLGLSLAAVALLAGGCLLGGPSWDKYDDSIRGTHELPVRVRFGQRIGPDGDGCWPQDRQRGGTVFCDLISVGGLHWDSGEVEVNEAVDIDVGSGFVCVQDRGGAPWCWEWSDEVPPRPARAPQGEAFRKVRVVDSWTQKVEGAPGFACGMAHDGIRVVCWSVGVDQPQYRQSNHRSRDGSQWSMHGVRDDPPRFRFNMRETGRAESFHAFTGEELTRPVEAPSLLVTETVR